MHQVLHQAQKDQAIPVLLGTNGVVHGASLSTLWWKQHQVRNYLKMECPKQAVLTISVTIYCLCYLIGAAIKSTTIHPGQYSNLPVTLCAQQVFGKKTFEQNMQ